MICIYYILYAQRELTLEAKHNVNIPCDAVCYSYIQEARVGETRHVRTRLAGDTRRVQLLQEGLGTLP